MLALMDSKIKAIKDRHLAIAGKTVMQFDQGRFGIFVGCLFSVQIADNRLKHWFFFLLPGLYARQDCSQRPTQYHGVILYQSHVGGPARDITYIADKKEQGQAFLFVQFIKKCLQFLATGQI